MRMRMRNTYPDEEVEEAEEAANAGVAGRHDRQRRIHQHPVLEYSVLLFSRGLIGEDEDDVLPCSPVLTR